MTEEEFSKGVTCCHCMSVLFSVDSVISHAVKNPGHQYYKWGKGEGVLFIKPMLDYHLAEKNWDFSDQNNCKYVAGMTCDKCTDTSCDFHKKKEDGK